MHIHFKEDQSLEELFWPHIRAQLLPRLENIDPHHAVFAIRRALESEYGAVAAVLAAAVAATTKPAPRTKRRRAKGAASRVVKLRICAATEEACEQARRLLEHAIGCRMGQPRAGKNPRYADRQKWFSYGEWEV